PRARPQYLATRAIDVISEAEPRLEHLPVGRDFAVGGEGLTLAHRPDERREKHRFRRRDRVGLDLRLPAQPVVQRQTRIRLPGVLEEYGQLALHEILGARLLDGDPADAGLLQVQLHGADDRRPRRARGGSGRIVGAVGALDVPGPELQEPQEPADAAEDDAAVGEADERLVGQRAVEFGPKLDQMVAARERDVVQYL